MINLINIKKLEKGSGKDFYQELAGVPLNLDESNIKSFYTTISDIFKRNEISEVSIVRSLMALYKVITEQNQTFIDVFQENNYALDLPFESTSKSIKNSLLDVLYALSDYAPLAFNSEVSDKIDQYFIKYDARKALTIIGVYAQHFDEIECPWPMLDLLFKANSKYFRNDPECCQNYVSLLVYLCKEYEKYRSERITYCWEYACKALNSDHEPTLTTCYNSLCILYELDPETVSTLNFPVFTCSIHLRKSQDVSDSVLSLLFRFQPNFESSNGNYYFSRSRNASSPTSLKSSEYMYNLVQSLIEASQKNVNANLILVKMAKNYDVARILLHDVTWMTKSLPSQIDTMRLFAIILSHEELRNTIMKKKEVIDFLRSICNLKSSGILTAICIFVRRFELNQEYINSLSKSEFLIQFFATAFDSDDETTLHAGLVMADTISKYCYVPELFNISENVANLAKSDGDLALTAGKVAVQMCKYPKCAYKFKQLKLDEFYSNRIRSPNLRKIAVHFLKTFKEISSELENEKFNQVMNRSSPVVRRLYNDGDSFESGNGPLSPPVTPKIKGSMANSTRNAKPKKPV